MTTFDNQQRAVLDARGILLLQPHSARQKAQVAWLAEVHAEHRKLGKCKYSSSGECEAVQFARSILAEDGE